MNLYQLQSEDTISQIKTQENLQFVDAGLFETKSAPDLGPFRPDSDSGAGLGSFLSRPVQINSFSWQEANTAAIQATFNPWELYFLDPGIARKLDNYKLLRCKLHLKFVVNASPFFYGSLRVSYNPLADGRDNYRTTPDQLKLSQTPGLYLEPASMTTSEMELPFLWPNSWLNVADRDEFMNMGRIQYVLYSKLRSANGVAAADVRVACYAWATDVELAGLTSTLSLQSDEYESVGSISGPASAIAKVAGKLASTPVIGPFATATEIGAGAVANIARIFGFSNPPVIDDVKPVAPKAFHAFSSVDTSVPLDKLSLDPKNEVTVDNTVAGASSEDPLLLKNLLSRESFVQGTLWQGAYVENRVIWTIPVTPMIIAQSTDTGNSLRHYTPASYFGQMFKYWRGGMTYRLRFIKSKYHTGRLIITWDPTGLPGTDYETTTMVRIVDLQMEDEVTLTIPYKQQTAWSTTQYTTNNFSNGSVPSLTLSKYQQNGVLQVRVLTTLTGPAATPEIDILCFASAASDMELSVPQELPDVSIYDIQSADVISSVSGLSTDHNVDIVTVGETVASLRTLLHRSSQVGTQVLGRPALTASTWVTDGLQCCVNYFPRVPIGYGASPLGSSFAVGSSANYPFAFVANHPINWVLNCFTGYRGAIVHHFNVERNGVDTINLETLERDDRIHILESGVNARNRFTATANVGAPSSLARLSISNQLNVRRRAYGQRGLAITNCETQAGLSIVSPQYSSWRFRPAYEPVRDIFPTLDKTEFESIRLDTSFRATSVGPTSAWPIVSQYVAAGVDFNPIYFVCTPTLSAYATPTASDAFTP